MNQDLLRQRVKILRALKSVSYKELASYLEISVSGIYCWLAGNYELGYSKQKRLEEILCNLE